MKTARRTGPSAASLKEIPEVSFRNAVRGKYARRLGNLIVLDSDLQEAFPDSASVNQALRALLALGRAAAVPNSRGKRRTSHR